VATTRKIDLLRARKSLLVQESELNRQAIALEFQQVQAASRWVERGYEAARSSAPWLKLGLPAGAILLLLRRRRAGLPGGPALFTGWRRWQSLRGILALLRGRS
jgi:hypothetical protein